jgi:hypothetical protein
MPFRQVTDLGPSFAGTNEDVTVCPPEVCKARTSGASPAPDSKVRARRWTLSDARHDATALCADRPVTDVTALESF